MTTTFLNTKSMSYGELIGNGVTYIVPPYQRDYAWEEEFWEDLWQDVMEIPNEKYHYTGYVVLQESEKKKFSIIDGQQRLTTITIISLACIKLLDEWIQNGVDAENNKQRKEKLIERFIGNRPASSLKLSSKLRLNKNSDGFFQSYLIDQREPKNKTKLKPTEKLLWSAFEYFCEKVREKFQASQSGEAVAFFLEETLAEGLLFTTIYVDDDINAYKVFETLNARGVKLSTTDLLKNSIFSLASSGGESDVVSFRYNVIGGLNPNIAEGLYNKAAIRTTEGALQTAKAIFQEIKPLYVSDEKFKSDFSLKTISSRSQKISEIHLAQTGKSC